MNLTVRPTAIHNRRPSARYDERRTRLLKDGPASFAPERPLKFNEDPQ